MPARSRRDPYEPWLHEASGFWCKKFNGKLEYLSRDYTTAKHKLRRLVDNASDSLTRDWLEAPFASLADEYLEDVKARRAPATYTGYRYQLLRAMQLMGPQLKVGQLRRIHLAKIEQMMTADYSPVTIRDTIAVVQQVFNWAVRSDLLTLWSGTRSQTASGARACSLTMNSKLSCATPMFASAAFFWRCG